MNANADVKSHVSVLHKGSILLLAVFAPASIALVTAYFPWFYFLAGAIAAVVLAMILGELLRPLPRAVSAISVVPTVLFAIWNHIEPLLDILSGVLQINLGFFLGVLAYARFRHQR
jgi:hypothetical protein